MNKLSPNVVSSMIKMLIIKENYQKIKKIKKLLCCCPNTKGFLKKPLRDHEVIKHIKCNYQSIIHNF